MKKILLIVLSMLFVQADFCAAQGPQIIERPVHGLRNTTTIEIERVILSADKTVLDIHAYFTPRQWIKIASDTYLQAGGKKYIITGAEGIEIDAEHYMPDSGEERFSLIFPAIPAGTRKIDFIESDCDNCFKLWDIDLTGESKESYKPLLPADILNFKEDKNASLPAPEPKMGRTKLTIHPLGLKEGYALGDMNLYFYNIFSLGQEAHTAIRQPDGTYVIEFEQYSPAYMFLLRGNRLLSSLYLSPGEHADFYYDFTAASLRDSRYHPMPDIVTGGFRGVFEQVNNQFVKGYRRPLLTESIYYKGSDMPDKTAADYIAYWKKRYDFMVDSVKNADCSSAMRQLSLLELKNQYAVCILKMPSICENAYWYKNIHNDIRLSEEDMNNYAKPEPVAQDILDMMEVVDVNDPWLIYAQQYKEMIDALMYKAYKNNWTQVADKLEGGLIEKIYKNLNTINKAVSMEPLTQQEQETLESAPYIKKVYATILAETKKKYDDAIGKGGFTILDAPDVAVDGLLDAIIARQKGKAVFVDFWATWCGPCLGAMQALKPLKPGIEEKGVVFIYLTGPSSPKGKWTAMLPDIGGNHYYLNDEQWKGLGEKYGVEAIPTYMIFDKEGNKSFQTTGYPGNEKVLEELSKVW